MQRRVLHKEDLCIHGMGMEAIICQPTTSAVVPVHLLRKVFGTYQYQPGLANRSGQIRLDYVEERFTNSHWPSSRLHAAPLFKSNIQIQTGPGDPSSFPEPKSLQGQFLASPLFRNLQSPPYLFGSPVQSGLSPHEVGLYALTNVSVSSQVSNQHSSYCSGLLPKCFLHLLL